MCMVIDEQNNNVLVQDKINSDWNGITFPGGHVENAESLIDSTIREVKEETGLEIENLEPCGLMDWYNTDNSERFFVFLYKTSHFKGNMLDETREGKVFWIHKDELLGSDLAPKLATGMQTYLKLFFNDDIHEAYATWSESSKVTLN